MLMRPPCRSDPPDDNKTHRCQAPLKPKAPPATHLIGCRESGLESANTPAYDPATSQRGQRLTDPGVARYNSTQAPQAPNANIGSLFSCSPAPGHQCDTRAPSPGPIDLAQSMTSDDTTGPLRSHHRRPCSAHLRTWSTRQNLTNGANTPAQPQRSHAARLERRSKAPPFFAPGEAATSTLSAKLATCSDPGVALLGANTPRHTPAHWPNCHIGATS